MSDQYSILLDQLVDGTLDPTRFSHRDHLGVAVAALRRHELLGGLGSPPALCAPPNFFPALALIANGLEALATRAGCPGKFNATITFACMSLVAERLARSGNEPLDAILDDCVELTGQASLLKLYGPERLTIVHMARKMSAREVRLLDEVITEGLEAGVQGGLLLVFARRDITGGLDPGARALFEKLSRNAAHRAGLNAVVVGSTGFAGALVGGFVAGLTQLMRKRESVRVFGTTAEACLALATADQLDAVELQRAYARALGA
jgi:hypothetical protein